MNILWSLHLYPPTHNCGGEYMAHHINNFLISKGHQVKVLLNQANKHKIKNPYSFEDVLVFPPDQNTVDNLFQWCDVVFTHLDYTGFSINKAKQFKKPVVWFAHSDHNYQSVIDSNVKTMVVYNSEWIAEKLNYKHHSFVLYPPCDWRHYFVNDNPAESEYITLINLDYNKGGDILAKIAEAMPDKKFIGVKGSYSFDERGQHLTYPSNVTVLPNTPNILEVYRKTRILIMPSIYESWGRTATEAMCSGIPVICNKTGGLNENCGMAGIYINDRNNIDEWVEQINKLDNEDAYNKASYKAKMRSRELDPVENLKEFESNLLSFMCK